MNYTASDRSAFLLPVFKYLGQSASKTTLSTVFKSQFLGIKTNLCKNVESHFHKIFLNTQN